MAITLIDIFVHIVHTYIRTYIVFTESRFIEIGILPYLDLNFFCYTLNCITHWMLARMKYEEERKKNTSKPKQRKIHIRIFYRRQNKKEEEKNDKKSHEPKIIIIHTQRARSNYINSVSIQKKFTILNCLQFWPFSSYGRHAAVYIYFHLNYMCIWQWHMHTN